jgi:hypothetical protein
MHLTCGSGHTWSRDAHPDELRTGEGRLLDEGCVLVIVRDGWHVEIAKALFPDAVVARTGDSMIGRRIRVLVRTYEVRPHLDLNLESWERLAVLPRMAIGALSVRVDLSKVVLGDH